MMGFFDAEELLSNLQSGESILNDEIHYIAFDEKINPAVLSELEFRCITLGYSFNKIKIRQSCNTCYPVFIYIIKQTFQVPLLQLKQKLSRGRFHE
jgi:hypothetical protein